ncbi:hypothetical protein [Sphingopyxis sp. BSNA05]|uniref:hypothetical protein n=1 Tax=Sphingopyxis sp. BSNA05 TaxID=1236614 RepID=UPI001C27E7FD|nr:hypothetical protein [Sphingopyxis sp. BSNA05]
MRYWNTGDSATDKNLGYLESLGSPFNNISVDQYMNKLQGVIGVEKMLPKAVLSHFNLPSLFIGNSAYSWTDERLQENADNLCRAINEGLYNAYNDESLKKGGDADLSDRPLTKGEEIYAAVSAYIDCRGASELHALRMAVSGSMYHRMKQLDHWLDRKRPSPGGRPIESEIISVLFDIRRYADDFHHEPASYDFQQSRKNRWLSAISQLSHSACPLLDVESGLVIAPIMT